MSPKARAAGATRGRPRRPAVVRARTRLAAALTALAGVALAAMSLPVVAAAPSGASLPSGACAVQSARAWPVGPIDRRARIAELQRLRASCIDDAAFLAVLGALLLEDGDAANALVWLERAVMLDPGNLGARVDHAFALAALGEPAALAETAEQLRHRTDMPAALRARLYPGEHPRAYALPPARLGFALRRAWGVQGEASLLSGHEGNLDRSPRLSELTLTLPDGPLTLPVESRPRAGSATIAAAAVEFAYAPRPATVLRSGLILGARAAASHAATDWRQWQWAASASHTANGLRGYVDLALAGVGGPLGEPYALRRIALGAEARLGPCRARLAIETETRTQSRSASLDSRTDAWTGLLQCPLAFTASSTAGSAADWYWLLDLRAARDHPASDERPGGLQRSEAAGLRLAGPLGGGLLLEIGWRSGRSRDALGYSPLLENGARRRLALDQLSLELSAPLVRTSDQRLDAVFKWQGARQASNLPLFRYRANSSYGGLRWQW